MRYALIFLAAFATALAWTWYQRQGDAHPPVETLPEVSEVTGGSGQTIRAPAIVDRATGAPEPEAFPVNRAGDVAMMMRDVGFEQLDSNLHEWSRARGFPALDENGEFIYDQPYEDYDDTTLTTLAEDGDIWAQQVLAERLKATRPGEAAEWLRKAAGKGSVYAMVELGNLFMGHAKANADFKLADESLALDQVFALRDGEVAPEVSGYAWYAAAEQAGAGGVVGSMSIPAGMRRLTGNQLDEACNMAKSLLTDLRTARDQTGLGDFDRTPPPVIMAPDGQPQRTSCEPEQPIFDLSGCEQITVAKGEETEPLFWVCNGE